MKLFTLNTKEMALVSMFTLSAAPILFSSCSKDAEDNTTESVTEIKLRSAVVDGSVADWTRASQGYSDLKSGKTINVTVNKVSNDTQLYQHVLTAGSNGVMSSTTTMYFPLDGTNVNIYAYNGGNCTVPTVEADDKTTSTPVKDGVNLAVSTNSDQTTTTNREASDFLYGEKTNVVRTSDHITVQMKHMFARVTLNVTADSSINGFGAKLKTVTISDVIYKATYTVGNTDNAVVASTSNDDKATLTLFSNTDGISIPSNFSQNDTAVVVPQSMNDKVLTFATDKKNYTFKFSNTKFEAGKSYAYNVKLTAIGLTIAVEVKDWEAVDAVDIDAEYDVATSSTSGNSGASSR
jgi:hypothetical protein